MSGTHVADAGDGLGLTERGADLLPVLSREAFRLELLGEREGGRVILLAKEASRISTLSSIADAVVCGRSTDKLARELGTTQTLCITKSIENSCPTYLACPPPCHHSCPRGSSA